MAPDGVGQEESLPLWFRTSWTASPNIRLSGLVGLMTAGELRLEAEDGDNINTVDYDSAWIMGIFGKFTF